MPLPFDNFKKHVDLSPELQHSFYHITAERSYKRGATISEMGELRNHLFYIMSGSARVFYISGGKEHTYSFAFENEIIALSHQLVQDSNYVTTIEFLEPTKLAILPVEELQTLIRSHDLNNLGVLLEQMVRGLLTQMTILEERILVLQTYRAKERFEWLMKRYPKIAERANLTQIASFLGLTKETLYRIRAGKYT